MLGTYSEHFDIRSVIRVQRQNRSPNDRMKQMYDRVSPHVTVDGDTTPFNEADEEAIRIKLVPEDLETDQNKEFVKANRDSSEFTVVPSGDKRRIDLCHIVHGISVSHLDSLPAMYEQYWGEDFNPRLLHISHDIWDKTEYREPYEDLSDKGANKKRAHWKAKNARTKSQE